MGRSLRGNGLMKSRQPMDLTPLAAWNGEGANLFVSPRLISALDPHGIDRPIGSHSTLDLYLAADGEHAVLVDESGG